MVAAMSGTGKSPGQNAGRRLIVGLSGASGIVYGVRVLEALRGTGVETHLVMTKSAEVTLAYEMTAKVADIRALADVVHPVHDIGAAFRRARSAPRA